MIRRSLLTGMANRRPYSGSDPLAAPWLDRSPCQSAVHSARPAPLCGGGARLAALLPAANRTGDSDSRAERRRLEGSGASGHGQGILNPTREGPRLDVAPTDPRTRHLSSSLMPAPSWAARAPLRLLTDKGRERDNGVESRVISHSAQVLVEHDPEPDSVLVQDTRRMRIKAGQACIVANEDSGRGMGLC